MTAKELFDLIEGLPPEALCGTIHYSPDHLAWFRDGADKSQDMSGMLDAHAEALQRDALTDWLMWKTHKVLMLVALSDSVYLRNGMHFETNAPTRTHALAAAVRYVAGQADSSPSSS